MCTDNVRQGVCESQCLLKKILINNCSLVDEPYNLNLVPLTLSPPTTPKSSQIAGLNSPYSLIVCPFLMRNKMSTYL